MRMYKLSLGTRRRFKRANNFSYRSVTIGRHGFGGYEDVLFSSRLLCTGQSRLRDGTTFDRAATKRFGGIRFIYDVIFIQTSRSRRIFKHLSKHVNISSVRTQPHARHYAAGRTKWGVLSRLARTERVRRISRLKKHFCFFNHFCVIYSSIMYTITNGLTKRVLNNTPTVFFSFLCPR